MINWAMNASILILVMYKRPRSEWTDPWW